MVKGLRAEGSQEKVCKGKESNCDYEEEQAGKSWAETTFR
jgi:hypothetical protein